MRGMTAGEYQDNRRHARDENIRRTEEHQLLINGRPGAITASRSPRRISSAHHRAIMVCAPRGFLLPDHHIRPLKSQSIGAKRKIKQWGLGLGFRQVEMLPMLRSLARIQAWSAKSMARTDNATREMDWMASRMRIIILTVCPVRFSMISMQDNYLPYANAAFAGTAENPTLGFS